MIMHRLRICFTTAVLAVITIASTVFGLFVHLPRTLRLHTCLPALIVLLMFESSSAAIVEISVSGRVGVDDPWGLLPGEIQTGEPWSGLIRYHTDLADSDPDPRRGYYTDASRPDGLSISVAVHGHVFAGGFGDLHAEVLNDAVYDPSQVFNPLPGDLFSIGGPMSQSPYLLDFPSIFFSWYDPTGAALATEALPTSLNPFDFAQSPITGETLVPTFSPVYIQIVDIGLSTPENTIRYFVVASIESAQVRAIPEPPTMVLGLLGLLLCSQLCRQRQSVNRILSAMCST